MRGVRRWSGALLALVVMAGAVTLSAGPAAAAPAACGGAAQNGLTITPNHDVNFFTDLANGHGFDAAYLSYTVANGGAARSNLWLTVGSFTGGSVTLADPTDDRQQIASLGGGGAATRFFLAKATAVTATAQTHTVTVYDRRPDLAGATSLATCTFTFAGVLDAQQASANKVTVITTSTSNPVIGDTLTVTVTGGTGQANGAMWVSPASSSTWPSKALRLESTLIEVDKTNDGTYEESYSGTLYVPSVLAANYTSSTVYRTTYVFRATKGTSTAVPVKPVAEISSGGMFKHTGSYPSLPTVSVAASSSPVTVTKSITATAGQLASLPRTTAPNGVPGATTYVEVPYRLQAATSAGTVQVDEFADIPPAGLVYKTGSATATDTTRTAVAIPDPSTSSADTGTRVGAVHFTGPFMASTSTPARVDYVMYVPVTAGTYRNTGFATIGDTTLGATASTVPFASVTTNGSDVTGTATGTTGSGWTSQTITFPALADQMAGAAAQTAAATASSGLPVSYATSTPSVCSVSGAGVTPLAVGTCTVTATQEGNATYGAAAPVSRSFAVTAPVASPQTITFATQADQVLSAGARTVSPTASSGLPVTLASTTTGVCTVTGSTITPVAAGTCTVTADQAGNALWDPAPQVTRSFAISKDPQAITFPALADQGRLDGPQTASATATSGLGVTFTSQTTSVCTVSGSTVTVLAVGDCTVAADQPGDASYAAAPTVTRTFHVAKADQAITFGQPADSLLSDGTVTVSGSADSGQPVAFSTATPSVCTVSGTTVTLLAAGTCTVHADAAGDADFNPAPTVVRSFAVQAAPGVPVAQTITFPALADQGRFDGTQTAAATADSGLVVSYTSQTPGVCSVSGATVTVLAVGDCTIAADQAGDSAYAAAPTVARTFHVAKAAQAVTFPQPADASVTDGTVSVSGSSDAALPVTFTSTTTAVCTVSGTTVTLLAAGTCTIAADAAGDADHLAAPTVTRSFAVAAAPVVPQPQTIVFATPADSPLGGPDVTLVAGASSLLPVTLTSSTPAVCTVAGGHATLLATGTCTVVATQAGDSTYAAATPVTRSFQVTPAVVPTPTPTPTTQPTPTTPTPEPATTTPVVQPDRPVGVALSHPGGAPDTGVTVVAAETRTVPVTCLGTNGDPVVGCTVRLYAVVGGRLVLVGLGVAAATTTAVPQLAVPVTLTPAGRRLAVQAGGIAVQVRADVTVTGATAPQRSTARTRLVTRHQVALHPVFFDVGSSTLRDHDRRYLDRLRSRLAGARTVTCVGYTDSVSSASFNHSLGMRRAVVVCARLTRGLDVRVRLVTRGEHHPFATNESRRGRQLNRRTEIRLLW